MKVSKLILLSLCSTLCFRIAQFSKISTALYTSPPPIEQDEHNYLIIIGTIDGNIHAIDESLQKQWTTSTGTPLTFSATAGGTSTDTEPRNKHKINSILPTLDGSLMFHTTDGMKRTPLKAKSMANLSPFISQENMLFTGNRHSRLISVNMKDGSIIHDVGQMSNSMEGRTLPVREESKTAPKTVNPECPVFPFWFGRIDYTLQAVDMQSSSFANTGPIESSPQYHVRYSEVYPLHQQSLPHPSSSTGSTSHQSIFDNDMLIYSTPEGFVYFLDERGNFLHSEPIALTSPAVTAYLVRLSSREKTSVFVSHITVEHGLNGLRFFHQMTIKQKHSSAMGNANANTNANSPVSSTSSSSKSLALTRYPTISGTVAPSSSSTSDDEHVSYEHAPPTIDETRATGGTKGLDDEKMVLVQSIVPEISQQEHLYAMELSLTGDMLDFLYQSYQQSSSEAADVQTTTAGGLLTMAPSRYTDMTDMTDILDEPTAVEVDEEEEKTPIELVGYTVAKTKQKVPVLPWTSPSSEALTTLPVEHLSSILTPPPVDPLDEAVTQTHSLLRKKFPTSSSLKSSLTHTLKQSLFAFEETLNHHFGYRYSPVTYQELAGEDGIEVMVEESVEETTGAGDRVKMKGKKEAFDGVKYLTPSFVIQSPDQEEDKLREILSHKPLVQYTSTQHRINSIHRLTPGYVDEEYFLPYLLPHSKDTGEESSYRYPRPSHAPTDESSIQSTHDHHLTGVAGNNNHRTAHLYWYMSIAMIIGILLTSATGFLLYQRLVVHHQNNKHSTSTSSESSKEGVLEEKLPEEDAYGKILTRVGAMIVYDKVLGYGSYGTIVYLGTLHGRFVAVKRMLSQLHKVADREISLLIKSDGHPNVIRYYSKELHQDFIYLGLQLSVMSLRDFIGKLQYYQQHLFHLQQEGALPPSLDSSSPIIPSIPFEEMLLHDDLRCMLLQIAEGVNYLHGQKIVHRDIKPHNILCVTPKDHYATNHGQSTADTSSSSSSSSSSTSSSTSSKAINPQITKLAFPNTLDDFTHVPIISLHQLSSFVLKISDMGLSKALEGKEGEFEQSNGSSIASFAAMHWMKANILSSSSSRKLPDDQQSDKIDTITTGSGMNGEEEVGDNNNAAAGSGSNKIMISLSGYEPGTSGWQAPEVLHGRQKKATTEHLPTTTNTSMILKSDIFSLGCVFYYILSQGEHPFGDHYERERNILSPSTLPTLSALQCSPEGLDLLQGMLLKTPEYRMDSTQVIHHPFFWTNSKKLEFLLEFSDRLEQESSSVTSMMMHTTTNMTGTGMNTMLSPVLLQVESAGQSIFAAMKRWDRTIELALIEESGKYRKYDPFSVRDLLRLIRNKRHHYYELSQPLKQALGSLPNGFYLYFSTRFPLLLLQCVKIALQYYATEPHFLPYLQDVTLSSSIMTIQQQQQQSFVSSSAKLSGGITTATDTTTISTTVGVADGNISGNSNGSQRSMVGSPTPKRISSTVTSTSTTTTSGTNGSGNHSSNTGSGSAVYIVDTEVVEDDKVVDVGIVPSIQQTLNTNTNTDHPPQQPPQPHMTMTDEDCDTTTTSATTAATVDPTTTTTTTQSQPALSPLIISPDMIVWHQSALQQSLLPYGCRFGWYRDTTDWVTGTGISGGGGGNTSIHTGINTGTNGITSGITGSTSGNTGITSGISGKKAPAHILKALQDPKYRTRLCSHWENTGGGGCPMRKKGKCIFAHGPIELRCKETRREKWGKVVYGSSSSISGSTSSSSSSSVGGGGSSGVGLFASGGEDVITAARMLEKGRVDGSSSSSGTMSSMSTGMSGSMTGMMMMSTTTTNTGGMMIGSSISSVGSGIIGEDITTTTSASSTNMANTGTSSGSSSGSGLLSSDAPIYYPPVYYPTPTNTTTTTTNHSAAIPTNNISSIQHHTTNTFPPQPSLQPQQHYHHTTATAAASSHPATNTNTNTTINTNTNIANSNNLAYYHAAYYPPHPPHPPPQHISSKYPMYSPSQQQQQQYQQQQYQQYQKQQYQQQQYQQQQQHPQQQHYYNPPSN